MKDRFEYTPQGYIEAKGYLLLIGAWEKVSTSGLSCDGWSIIAEANAIYAKEDKD